LSLVALLAVAGRAQAADDKEAARKYYNEATRYYDLNDPSKALDLFKKAYLSYEDPVFLFNIGQCERQLGNKVEAVKAYKSYLRKAPANVPNRESVRKLVGQLEEAIAAESAVKQSPPQESMHPSGDATAAAAAGEKPSVPAEAMPQNAQPAGTLTRSAESTPAEKPLVKKPWFWAAVGGAVVAVGLGVGLGVGLTSGAKDPGAPSIGVVR
jgi:tetratricopeptide (TPR) repeat protein